MSDVPASGHSGDGAGDTGSPTDMSAASSSEENDDRPGDDLPSDGTVLAIVYGFGLLLYVWLVGVCYLLSLDHIVLSRIMVVVGLAFGLGLYLVGLFTEQFAARRWAAAEQWWALETVCGLEQSELPPHPLDDLSDETRRVLLFLSLYAKGFGPSVLCFGVVGAVVISLTVGDPTSGGLALLVAVLFGFGVLVLMSRGPVFVRLPTALRDGGS